MFGAGVFGVFGRSLWALCALVYGVFGAGVFGVFGRSGGWVGGYTRPSGLVLHGAWHAGGLGAHR
jgi:hypothetical protein